MAKRYQLDEEDIRYTAGSPRATLREEYLTETKPERTYEIGYEEGKSAAEEAAARAAEAQSASAGGSTASPTYKPETTTGAGAAAGSVTDAAEKKQVMADDVLDKLLNGDKFRYDVSADPTFQSLMAIATKNANKARADTMAHASAMTGGYGNTYALAAADRAAAAERQAALDKAPELEQAAYNRYLNDRADLKDQYSILAAREAAANEEAWRNKEWEHTLEREAVEDAREDRKFEETVRQFDLSRADQREQFAATLGLDYAKFEENRRQFGITYALDQAKFEHDAYMDEVSASQNQQKIDIDREDLNAHIDGSYYKGETSGTTTTPKAGYNSDGTKKRTDKEIQTVADGLWNQYKAAWGSQASLTAFEQRLENQYSDDADRIMAVLSNRADAIDDNITRRGTKVHGYTD